MRRRTVRRPGTAPAGGPSSVAAALDREWRRDYEKAQFPVPLAWRDDERLGSFNAVVDVLVALEDAATPVHRSEEVTLALAERAGAGDFQASRVLIQFLSPCCVRLAFTHHRPHLGSGDRVLDDLLTAAWDVVRTGVDSRGRAMKLMLLRQIEYWALRRPSRALQRLAEREVLVLPEDICAMERTEAGNVNPGEEVVRLLAQAMAVGLGYEDVRLLGGLSFGGSSTEELAAQEGVTSRTIRYRRAEATRRLALLST